MSPALFRSSVLFTKHWDILNAIFIFKQPVAFWSERLNWKNFYDKTGNCKAIFSPILLYMHRKYSPEFVEIFGELWRKVCLLVSWIEGGSFTKKPGPLDPLLLHDKMNSRGTFPTSLTALSQNNMWGRWDTANGHGYGPWNASGRIQIVALSFSSYELLGNVISFVLIYFFHLTMEMFANNNTFFIRLVREMQALMQ